MSDLDEDIGNDDFLDLQLPFDDLDYPYSYREDAASTVFGGADEEDYYYPHYDEEQELGDHDDFRDFEESAGSNMPQSMTRLLEDAAHPYNFRSEDLLMYDGEEGLADPDEIESDDEMDWGLDEIRGNEIGFDDDGDDYGSRRKKKLKKGKGKAGKKQKEKQKGDPRVESLLGQASQAYAMNEVQNAFNLLQEVIKIDFKSADAWKLMAMVHEELGDPLKAKQANFLCAHLRPKDKDLWYRLATQSMMEGNDVDAVYCLGKAITADPSFAAAWFDRANIYARHFRFRKAIEGYSTVLRLAPYDMRSIRELSKIFLALRDGRRAMSLFEAAMEADRIDPLPIPVRRPDEEVVAVITHAGQVLQADNPNAFASSRPLRVGIEELDLLAELYIQEKDYEKAFVVLAVGLLRIIGKWDVLWSQFDEFAPEFDWLQPWIRCKLTITRLWLDDADRSKRNFAIMCTTAPISTQTMNLYYDVVDSFSAKRMFDFARHICEMLMSVDATNNSMTWRRLAYCFQQIGELERAVELYCAAIEVETKNIDARLQLAEVYEALGDMDKAKETVDEVNKLSKLEAGKLSRFKPTRPRRKGTLDVSLSSSVASTSVAPTAFLTGSMDRKEEDDSLVKEAELAIKSKENREHWAKIHTLLDKLEDNLKRADFLRTIRTLVARFQSTRAFYPADRAKVFTGLGRSKDPVRNLGAFVFQGLNIDEWYEAFVKYAFALSIDGKDEDAQAALRSAFDANVFYHDEKRRQCLKMQMIASAIYCGNYGGAWDILKWFILQSPYANDLFRLCSAIFSSGLKANSIFASTTTSRYYRRMVHAYDAELAKDPSNQVFKNPILSTLYGHMLMSGRTYRGAIEHFLAAYKLAPQDPMINLSIGIAYAHLAMQRSTSNRHQGVLLAVTFLLRYEELAGESMEAAYNLGRAFHQLGLNDFAVRYYQKVLGGPTDDPKGHLKMEAAFNLSLIFVASGSYLLAHRTLMQNIVF